MDNQTYTLTIEQTLYTLDQLQNAGTIGAEGPPLALRPQIALAGRSNVGKSSLLNALAGRKQLAKVSSTPGKTASINFYRVDPGAYYLVDLPGYGYAQRSKNEREQWSALIAKYLKNARGLKALILLLDCRLPPQNSDLDLLGFARSIRLPVLPALTKADKCKLNERAARQAEWRKLLGSAPILTSSAGPAAARLGIADLWQAIARVMEEKGDE